MDNGQVAKFIEINNCFENGKEIRTGNLREVCFVFPSFL